MRGRKRAEMKYLPQMAVSWETAAAFSLFCFSLGAAFCALALRQRKERRSGPEAIEFTTASARRAARRQNGAESGNIGTLAESLWLRTDPEPAVLSDREPATEPVFENPQTRAFWTEEIEPNRRLFEKRRELAVIERVLLELDEHGLCSSVVSGDGKSAFAPTARRFSRVTLLDHSLRVARCMREIHDSLYTERILFGKHLIAALAHDVGKMEHLRPEGGRYVKDDHAAASARALNAWIMECGGERAALELRSVVDSVRNHHRSANAPDPILENLKRADTAAREEEFSGVRKSPRATAASPDGTDAEPPEWLLRDMPRILNDHVGPAINTAALEEAPFARAISSTNGIVYVCPHYLFDGVREHMEREEIADMRFFDPSRPAELRAKLLVTNSLKARNWVGDGVRDGYYAAFWNYEYGGKKVRKGGFWVPVFSEAFEVALSELERRKNSELRRITSVSPCLARGRKK
ncbi:MAG: HD domain-containing protein [Candidatus Dadabacteria bacterium]|nr:HD domain-containing protein [Candidatus Dadabacteria bacterium]